MGSAPSDLRFPLFASRAKSGSEGFCKEPLSRSGRGSGQHGSASQPRESLSSTDSTAIFPPTLNVINRPFLGFPSIHFSFQSATASQKTLPLAPSQTCGMSLPALENVSIRCVGSDFGTAVTLILHLLRLFYFFIIII